MAFVGGALRAGGGAYNVGATGAEGESSAGVHVGGVEELKHSNEIVAVHLKRGSRKNEKTWP